MTLVELLEEDRERLLSDLANQPGLEQAEETLEKEADRLLYRYSETEKQEGRSRAASDMMQVCRMSLPLIDTVGGSVVWTAEDGSRRKTVLLPAVLCAAGAAVMVFLFAGGGMPEGFGLLQKIMMCAGLILLFAGAFLLGRQTGSSRDDARRARQKVENRIDAGNAYRKFRGVMQVIDQTIERVPAGEAAAGEYRISGPVSEGEIALYAGLLEALYSRDGDTALDKLEDIRYFLHRNNIEAVDYDTASRDWFDVMPSEKRATIRPALVSGGELLKKGLAAGGM